MSGKPQHRINEPNVSSEAIDGEVIIVNLLNGNYYSAQDTGAYIWGKISHGESLDSIQADLCQQFADLEAVIRVELRAFHDKLASEDLIVEANGLGANASMPVDATLPTQYAAPALNCYSDMSDLLLLDPIHDVEDGGWPKKKQAWPTADTETAD